MTLVELKLFLRSDPFALGGISYGIVASGWDSLSLELQSQAWQTNSAKILATAGDHVLVTVKVHGPVEARVVRVSDDRNHSWRQTWHGAGESISEEVWRTEIKAGKWHEISVTLDQPARADLTLNRVLGASK